jgi:xanthine dehydrogenase YagR molybdenum-binding subunit
VGKNINITYAELMARNGLATLAADADYDPIEEAKGPKAVLSFSAVFAEVRVDPHLGLVRVNRFVGAYDAGRIINPKTGRSQAIGGIIWGVGQALLEQSETDPVMGRLLSRNYSGYLVPTNADIPDLDILFVGEFDEEASPLGAKGLGELTAVSVAPAIANAVYHATGTRARNLPITVEVFDAYSTLYDVQSVLAKAEALCPGRGEVIIQVWRLKQLEYAWLRSLLKQYEDFWEVTRASLDFALRAAGVEAP